MELYILRHGIAAEQGTPGIATDSERPLTAEGERKLWRVAEAMERMELQFDRILSSPYLRARQTAEIIAKAFDLHKVLQNTDALEPGGDHKRLVHLLNEIKCDSQSVLLVGHEPSLSELVARLVSGGTHCSLVLKKGGLCKLTAAELSYGRCAFLEWLLTPKQMALMR
jgi:phosphohistidine phosphatase